MTGTFCNKNFIVILKSWKIIFTFRVGESVKRVQSDTFGLNHVDVHFCKENMTLWALTIRGYLYEAKLILLKNSSCTSIYGWLSANLPNWLDYRNSHFYINLEKTSNTRCFFWQFDCSSASFNPLNWPRALYLLPPHHHPIILTRTHLSTFFQSFPQVSGFSHAILHFSRVRACNWKSSLWMQKSNSFDCCLRLFFPSSAWLHFLLYGYYSSSYGRPFSSAFGLQMMREIYLLKSRGSSRNQQMTRGIYCFVF